MSTVEPLELVGTCVIRHFDSAAQFGTVCSVTTVPILVPPLLLWCGIPHRLDKGICQLESTQTGQGH
jgi:hypothetical protein